MKHSQKAVLHVYNSLERVNIDVDGTPTKPQTPHSIHFTLSSTNSLSMMTLQFLRSAIAAFRYFYRNKLFSKRRAKRSTASPPMSASSPISASPPLSASPPIPASPTASLAAPPIALVSLVDLASTGKPAYLPNELWLKVFSSLDSRDLFSCMLVCSSVSLDFDIEFSSRVSYSRSFPPLLTHSHAIFVRSANNSLVVQASKLCRVA